jgi:hypothetical protein
MALKFLFKSNSIRTIDEKHAMSNWEFGDPSFVMGSIQNPERQNPEWYEIPKHLTSTMHNAGQTIRDFDLSGFSHSGFRTKPICYRP